MAEPRKIEFHAVTLDCLYFDPSKIRELPLEQYQLVEQDLTSKLGLPVEVIRNARDG